MSAQLEQSNEAIESVADAAIRLITMAGRCDAYQRMEGK